MTSNQKLYQQRYQRIPENRERIRASARERYKDPIYKAKKNAWNMDWQHRNKEKIRARSREYYIKSMPKRLKNRRIIKTKRRYQAMMVYSNGLMRCACCGESKEKLLTLCHDRINGVLGKKDVVGKNTSGSVLYQKLYIRNYPPGFQVLCFNCNLGGYKNGGLCPHFINAASKWTEEYEKEKDERFESAISADKELNEKLKLLT